MTPFLCPLGEAKFGELREQAKTWASGPAGLRTFYVGNQAFKDRADEWHDFLVRDYQSKGYTVCGLTDTIQDLASGALSALDRAAAAAADAGVDLLKTALSTFGIDGEKLWSGLQRFTSDAVGAARALVNNGGAIWDTLIKGVMSGLASFLNVPEIKTPLDVGALAKGALKRIIDVLGGILHIDDLQGLIDELVNSTDLLATGAGIALKLVGLDLDSILGLVGEIAGPYGPMAVGFVSSFIGGVEEKGLWGEIEQLLDDGKEWLSGATAAVEALPQQLLDSVIGKIKDWIPQKVVEGLGLIIAKFATGPAGWATFLLDAITYMIDNWSDLEVFANTLADGFKALIAGAAGGSAVLDQLSGKVSTTVSSGLEKGTGLLIKGVLKLVRLKDLPTTVDDILDTGREVAQKPLRGVITALVAPIQRIFADVQGDKADKDAEATPPVLGADHKTLYWVQKDRTDGEWYLWSNASPNRRLKQISKESKLARVAPEAVSASKQVEAAAKAVPPVPAGQGKPKKTPAQKTAAKNLGQKVKELKADIDAEAAKTPGADSATDPAGIAGKKAYIKTTEGEYWVAKHKDFTPRGPDTRSHHGLMSAWMEAHFPKYNADEAPTIHLPTGQHYNTYGVYNQWRAEITRRTGSFDWKKVTEADVRILSKKMLDASKVPQQVRDAYWKDFNIMLRELRGGAVK